MGILRQHENPTHQRGTLQEGNWIPTHQMGTPSLTPKKASGPRAPFNFIREQRAHHWGQTAPDNK